ncbi:hypothetical protein ACFLZB_02795 [Nanoarchaeota archaeon]
MKLKHILGIEMEEQDIMKEIKKAVESGFHEIKLGEVVIKLPKIDNVFDKHIAPWEK